MTATFRKFKPGVTLWQRGYVDDVINSEKEFVNVLRYIFLNPVKEGLSEGEFDYPFSGALDYFTL